MTDFVAELNAPYPVTPEHQRQFRADGFIKLPNVFSPAVLDHYGAEITRLTLTLNPHKNTPLEARGTYGKAFIQVSNLWPQSATARAFSFSRRLAGIATALLGTRGVRMYHDQALYKEAGGGFTPWHVDQQYWPMATGKCVTAWIPLQPVPMELGPLCFGKGSHRKRIARDMPISDESERIIAAAVAEQKIVEVSEPYALGDVSFHAGWTLHRAGPNTSAEPRKVHTVIYMDVDMRLQEPRTKGQQADWERWTPSTKIGEIMTDPLNPVLHEDNH